MADDLSLTDNYDKDQGLASKRNWLVNSSVVLLAINFSGAKIEEANTFIFKIVFSNQNGLGALLALVVFLLIIRYYNYAKPYQDRLYSIWAGRLVSRPYFYSYCHYSDGVSGVILDSCPEGVHIDEIKDWKFQYVCGLPFTRYIEHEWVDPDCGGDTQSRIVNIYNALGAKVYLSCLYLEAREQFKSFFTHRENLDILFPYFIGGFAIASHYFNAHLLLLLKLVTPSS